VSSAIPNNEDQALRLSMNAEPEGYGTWCKDARAMTSEFS
jgi:hypothetical protein